MTAINAAALAPDLPAWAMMWAVALLIYAMAKLCTLRAARIGTSPARIAGYVLAWPGMDPDPFLQHRNDVARPAPRDWLPPALRLALGGTLVWGMVRTLVADRPLLAGWIGATGLILLLHFGTFHLLALAWQRGGVGAEPIMRRPAASTSLGEFWGKRWNLAFNELARRLVFDPLRRRAGVAVATTGSFLASGLIHELVISLPAGGGYGLPTAYFLAQDAGVLLQRSRPARRLRLDRGARGRIVTVLFVVAPLHWLFHQAFMLRVIVPFLDAIGSF